MTNLACEPITTDWRHGRGFHDDLEHTGSTQRGRRYVCGLIVRAIPGTKLLREESETFISIEEPL